MEELDQEHLTEIVELLGKDDLQGIVNTFTDHSRELLSKLEALQNLQSEELVLLLHSLKGCCRNMGAVEMAERFSVLESRARNAELDDLARLMPSLHSELDRTIQSLHAFIHSH